MSATVECVSCKKSFPDDQLLFTRGGRICPFCQNERDQETSLRRGIWLTVIGGPTLGAGGWGLSCFFSIFSALVAGLMLAGFGVAMFVHAARAASLAWSLSTDYADLKVGGLEKGALLISAVVTTLFGFGLLAMGLWMFVVGWQNGI